MPEGPVTFLAFLLGGAALGLSASLAIENRRLNAVATPIVLLVALALMLSVPN